MALATIASTTLASAAFTSSTVNHGSTWAVGIDRYFNAVRADGPHTYYRLDEAGGVTMRDSGTGDRAGSYAAVSAYRLPGALTENPGYAVALTGQGRLVSGGSLDPEPGLPGASFTGEIDEFAVFTNRLSATRVSAHYAAR